MAELQIKELQQPGKISFNYEELKAELTEKVKTYETMVYTEENMKDAKADRANLNRLSKAINDERIKREKEFMQPFQEFKDQIKEITTIIDKTSKKIDAQIKEFEEAQKTKKLNDIESWFDENYKVNNPVPEFLQISDIFNPKWLNASESMAKISGEVDERVKQIQTEITTIQSLPEFSFEALEVYKNTLDINRAISEGKRLADIQKRKQEAEQRAKEEAETRRIEEEARKAAAETAKPEIEPQEPQKPGAQWLRFQALLTIEQAKELKAFFESHDIKFKPM